MKFITTDKQSQVYECIECTYRCFTVKARLERVGTRWTYDATVTYECNGVDHLQGTLQASSINKFQAKRRVVEFFEELTDGRPKLN